MKIALSLFFMQLTIFSFAQQKIERWGRYELILNHSYKGNAFADVNLTAKFSNSDTAYIVDGFYDGDNTFKVRFMPGKTGTWKYVTTSNGKQLNNQKDFFECMPAAGNNHGIIKVDDTYNFKYADGKQYYPVGTTAYAWNHMGRQLQETTLQTLQDARFNKIRMCVFPKDYNLVKEEPEIYPFVAKGTEKGPDGIERRAWDFRTFNSQFFTTLEKQIDELNKLGIEADLILFHPYDKGRWGFDSLTMDVNMRYIKYIVARLASFRNIWWSIANEYE